MNNFEKSDIIAEVAYNKNKAKFLLRDEQMRLNNLMKQKLLRFLNEMIADKNRPETMKLFDAMMNDMHGKRVKDLYAYRREGNHVVALLCNSIPPEVVYGMGNFIPVSVCMGAGEVEPYADEYTKGMCSLARSMMGFLKTGMCVFFNLADHVLASDLCPDIRKASTIIPKISDDLDVYCAEFQETGKHKINLNFSGLQEWVSGISPGKGFNKEKLVVYAVLYSEIRQVYKSILGLRKNQNPPIDGKNSLWIQQLALVEEPKKLLSALKYLREELNNNVKENIGYDPSGRKKRIMLITPRIMPPFAEIFRLIESSDALIVCEEIDMGITNIGYTIEDLMKITNVENSSIEDSVRCIMENIDKTSSSCFEEFDIERIKKRISDYNVDAVINYSFKNCKKMEIKIKNINDLLNKNSIPSMALQTGYMEIYEKEDLYLDQISRFLNF
ncbi:MAG: 2-hydroxyacyl-CoA dehydratase family protein [Prolixibacteraceae bacterium]|jgi:benzoyl-CoA reductase/2-hydroxyglutaryl-CoA dehydratase subunit BcrC/BadD/HgdB|nr:2-hydroxyacyl-CoA dehydratase family protein [Prolixibacteraceae bacterium]